MLTRGTILAASLLFVLAGCGSIGSRTVTQTPSPTASVGATSDPGERWLGAEPVGGIVTETRPRVGGERRAAPASVVRTQPAPAPTPAPAPATYPPPPTPTGYPMVRPVIQIPPPPPPPTWPSGSTPPPPSSPTAVWRQAPGGSMPPPMIEHPGQPATPYYPPATPAVALPGAPPPPPGPEELVEWAPVGTRDPNAAANDSASLEGPPSGVLPAPVVRRRR